MFDIKRVRCGNICLSVLIILGTTLVLSSLLLWSSQNCLEKSKLQQKILLKEITKVIK
ncbi:hypothetical protein CPJCM30710_06270 [Clostridium polyendosporum]|uniref:Uncharacterized protein n=1 Tax=Clostridium polyendosporum TaxID=69208 RepID=A0A919VFX0_9CLOT|nr:hypothetical protein CPJCM30710_06270 [Clostridium polyendosporum]